MKKYTILLFTFLITGCATVKQDKVDTIAQEEVKKEYILPNLTQCQKPPKINDGTLEEFYTWGLDVKKILKECNQYNEEKKDWIERNFKK